MDKGSLTLTRKVGEKIVIGVEPDAVTVEVLRTGDSRTQLRVVAPKNVPVWREELQDAGKKGPR